MKKTSVFFIFTLILNACASLPSSTTILTKEIISEANNRHQLNIFLIKKLYLERMQQVDSFIKKEYTPSVISNYQKLLPSTLNYQKELPNIISSILPVINRKRDSLKNILKEEEQQIIKQLQHNFVTYTKATTALENLITSAVKLKAKENNFLNYIEENTETSPLIKDIVNQVNNSEKERNKFIAIEKLLKN